VQCEVAEDCVARGFPADSICEQQLCIAPPVDPVWGCLGSVEEPVIIPGETYTVSMVILDAITNMPPAGFSGRVCAALDLNCDAPVIDSLTADAEGRITFEVTAGFQGYVEANATDMMPALLPIGPVVANTPDVVEQVHLVRTSIVEAFATMSGTTLDTTKGHMLGLLVACNAMGRAGLSFAYEPTSGTPFYTIGFTPDTTATETDEAGRFGVLNLESGFVTFSAIRNETEETYGEVRTLIRPGILTYVGVGPTAM
jgi:hypothetical protein